MTGGGGAAGADRYLEAARAASAHVFVDDIGAPELRPDDRHHLERVLRLRRGEQVSVADGRGGWRLCAYTEAGGGAGGGALEPVGDVTYFTPPEPAITIGFAPTKGDRPEWAVQKLAEVGVDRIVPLATARSVVRWDGARAEHHLQRLREIARQAAMQSRRLTVPVVEPVSTLPAVLGALPAVLASAGGGAPALAEPGGGPPSLAHPVILVGPEGGWDPAELADAPATVSLGVTVLRTETATVVAGTLLVAIRSGFLQPNRWHEGD